MRPYKRNPITLADLAKADSQTPAQRNRAEAEVAFTYTTLLAPTQTWARSAMADDCGLAKRKRITIRVERKTGGRRTVETQDVVVRTFHAR